MCNSIDDPQVQKSSTSAFTHSALLKLYVTKNCQVIFMLEKFKHLFQLWSSCEINHTYVINLFPTQNILPIQAKTHLNTVNKLTLEASLFLTKLART